jgi:hypothetical protein
VVPLEGMQADNDAVHDMDLQTAISVFAAAVLVYRTDGIYAYFDSFQDGLESKIGLQSFPVHKELYAPRFLYIHRLSMDTT